MGASDYRGKQVTIGKIAFVFPEEKPVTDEEVIETEELIARITEAISPHEKKVKFARDVIKALQSDITRTMAARLYEADEPNLFNLPEDTKFGVTDVDGEDDDEEKWPECSGDPKNCPHNEGYGCCLRSDGTEWEPDAGDIEDDDGDEAEEGGEA